MDGEKIRGSNINDLILYSIGQKQSYAPNGCSVFMESLEKMNIPNFILCKHYATNTIANGRRVCRKTKGAPPGVKCSKKKKTMKDDIKWLRF